MNSSILHTNIRGHKATYHQLTNIGTDAHFYPSNGFPVRTYASLFKSLKNKFNLQALEMRACWENIGDPKSQTKFDIYADDLIDFLKQKYDKPIVGIGHSQGATCTLIAAARHPELFSKLILIEPASLSKKLAIAMKVVPYFYKKTREPFKSTLRKPSLWNTKEDYFHYCRRSRIYKRITDDILHEIVEHSLTKQENQYKLIYPPQWESSNYALPPNIFQHLEKVKLPIHIIAGKPMEVARHCKR